MRLLPWASTRGRPPLGRRRLRDVGGSGNALSPPTRLSSCAPQLWIRQHTCMQPSGLSTKITVLPKPVHCDWQHLSVAHCWWTCCKSGDRRCSHLSHDERGDVSTARKVRNRQSIVVSCIGCHKVRGCAPHESVHARAACCRRAVSRHPLPPGFSYN
jgi:hypothetical protein